MGEQEGERGLGKENNEQADKDPRLTNRQYTESKRLWKEFLSGRLSASELAEGFRQFEDIGGAEEVRDFFDGRIL